MKVLVVGAGGYVGRRLIEMLREHPVEVVGADVIPVPGFANRVVDLRFPDQTFSLLHRERPDVVVNLAYMLMEASAGNPQNAVHLNIVGIDGLFDAAVKLEIPRVVYASSGAVYGDQKDHGTSEVTEETPPHPRTLYGWMKHFNDIMAAQYNAIGVSRLISVRISSLHGRGKRGTFTPMDMIVDAVGVQDSLSLPWSAEHETSFIHVDDVCDVFIKLTLAGSPRWTIYNTGGDFLTMGELARFATQITGIKVGCSSPGRELLHVSRASYERFRTEFPTKRRSPREWLELEFRERKERLEAGVKA
jgi:nucleoside-diphosphate-sugar epimerase